MSRLTRLCVDERLRIGEWIWMPGLFYTPTRKFIVKVNDYLANYWLVF